MNQHGILLIDDEEEILEQFERVLTREGYSVDTALNGETGWEMYRKKFYDVVIVDWHMEGMNGMELLRRIDETHPFAKVIMITAHGDESTAVEAHHYHAFDYMKKPLHLNDLLEKVKEAIHRKDQVLTAIEKWVISHPEEAKHPIKESLTETGKKKS